MIVELQVLISEELTDNNIVSACSSSSLEVEKEEGCEEELIKLITFVVHCPSIIHQLTYQLLKMYFFSKLLTDIISNY